MKNFFKNVVLLALLLFVVGSYSQDLFNGTDLSTVKVDNLSNDDIAKIKAQLASKNMTLDSVKPMANARGMSDVEFNKLKIRLQTPEPETNKSQIDSLPIKKKKVPEKRIPLKIDTLLVFGSELFTNASLTFEPSSKIATPINYILGPGDELQISVFGVQEYNGTAAVSSEGKISVPFVGQIFVSGMPIEAATQKIKSAFAKIYTTLGSGQSKFNVTLAKIRTIGITIIGAKQPGNYSVSSLSTVYNALYVAGGPNKNGSFRNIELLRGNKVIKIIDIYRFLVNGDQSDNVGLRDGDVIRIPVYDNRVTIEGQVKRPGIFELKANDNFNDLLGYASGFTDVAFTAKINVLQKTDTEFKIVDVSKANFATFKPKNGDVIKVGKILNRFENRVKIEGTVFRPDTYSFFKGMRISDLIAKAEGLKEDAYKNRARIIRVKGDLTIEMLDVNLEKIIAGDKVYDLLLQKEDILTVYSLLDFKEDYIVSIFGEIKKEGEYMFYENLTLNDLLVQAGGLTGSASKKVEVARLIKSETLNINDPKKVELFELEILTDNIEQLENIQLQPFDVVTVRRLPVFEKPSFVTINGSVLYPGKYVLANKQDKVYDIIKRSGGFLSTANKQGLKVLRPIAQEQIQDLEKVNDNIIDKNAENSADKLKKIVNATIPIDWEKIEKNQNNNANIILIAGDVIQIPEYNDVVKVAGSVILTSEIPFNSGRGFNYYINAVGGVDSKAWKRKSYIVYPNGQAAVTSSFLFFRNYPKVLPGSQIIVPEKMKDKKAVTTTDIIGISSVLASLAGIIFAILK